MLKTFIAKAQELTKKYQPIFEKASQKTFVTQHTAFSYLAKRFGLKQLGIAGISPEQEPSPRQLTEIQEFVKTYNVKPSLLRAMLLLKSLRPWSNQQELA